jgi:hypothetical protein
MSTAWTLEPWVTPATVGVLAVVGIAWIVWRYRHDRSHGHTHPAWVSAGLRLLAVALWGAVLLNPRQVITTADDEPGTLAFLLDASGSMQRPMADDAEASRYRFALETWLDEAQLATWREHHDVRLYSFGERLRSTIPPAEEAEAEQSRLLPSVVELQRLLRRDDAATSTEGAPRRSAVVVLSDGADRSDLDAAAVGRQTGGVRLHTVTLGADMPEPDLALTARPRPAVWMIDEAGRVRVDLHAQHAAGMPVTVHLEPDDAATQTRRLTLPDDGRATIDFEVRHDTPGLYRYTARVEPLPGEAEAGNDTQPLWLRITDRQTRVLVLEGQPYWDTSFLVRALRADPRVRVERVTQVRPGRRVRAGAESRDDEDAPAVARSLEDWARHDVVVLGRGLANVLDDAAVTALRAWVDDGGRLVWARGPVRSGEAEAWGPLSPGRWDGTWHEGAALRPSAAMPAGLRSAFAATSSDRESPPRFERVASVVDLPPTAQVWARLMNEEESPALTTVPVGRGLVVTLLGEGLWRWHTSVRDHEPMPTNRATPSGGGGGGFEDFWSTLVRGLVDPEAAVADAWGRSLRLSAHTVGMGESVEVAVVSPTLRAEALLVVDEAGVATPLDLHGLADGRGRGGATWKPSRAGEYEVQVRDVRGDVVQRTPAVVVERRLERVQTAPDPALMRRLAEASGGRVLDPADPASLDAWLDHDRQSRQVPDTTRPAWDHPLLLAALLLLLGGEWIVRRKGGLA